MHLLGASLSERDQRKWESKLSSKRIFVTNKFPTRNINFQAISLPFLGRFWAKQHYFVLSAQAPLSHSALTSKLGKRRRMKLRKAPIRPSSLTRTMRKYLTFNSDHQLPLLRSSHCLPSQFSWLKIIIPMGTSMGNLECLTFQIRKFQEERRSLCIRTEEGRWAFCKVRTFPILYIFLYCHEETQVSYIEFGKQCFTIVTHGFMNIYHPLKLCNKEYIFQEVDSGLPFIRLHFRCIISKRSRIEQIHPVSAFVRCLQTCRGIQLH